MTKPKGSFHWIGNNIAIEFRNNSFGFEISWTDILHKTSADLGLNFSLKVLSIDGLNFACDFQWNAIALGNLDREVSAFDGSDPANKAQVRLFLLNQPYWFKSMPWWMVRIRGMASCLHCASLMPT